MRKRAMPFGKGRRKTGGRKRGTLNKFKRRDELENFLSLAQDGIDLVALAKRFLSGKNPNERVYLRILEYCFGKPTQPLLDVEQSRPIKIDISAIPMNDKPVS